MRLQLGIAGLALLLVSSCANATEEPLADSTMTVTPSTSDATGTPSASATTSSPTVTASPTVDRAQIVAKRRLAECQEAMEPLFKRLREIDSRLSVGLDVGELGDYLGDARVRYDDLDFKSFSNQCTLNVGIPLESALNEYLKSYNKWQSCIDRTYCEVEGAVLAGLRNHWTEATERLNYARKKLDDASAFKGPVFGD